MKFDAIPDALPDIIIMVLIVVIDALLKLAGTRKKLEYFDLNFNEEMIVAGTNNFFNFFALGAPGYSQLKFNLLNAGISGTFSREFIITSFISCIHTHTNSIDNTQVR